MSTVCVIPARGGSTRLPRKNIRLLAGKPVIAYSIETAKQSGLFDDVIVSTDDDEIAEIAGRYGANIWKRAYDDGARGTNEVAWEVLKTMPHVKWAAVVYPVAPLLEPEDLRWLQHIALRDPEHPTILYTSYGDDDARDAGAAYFGLAKLFSLPWPKMFPMSIKERAQDVNTEEDFAELERKFAALRGNA